MSVSTRQSARLRRGQKESTKNTDTEGSAVSIIASKNKMVTSQGGQRRKKAGTLLLSDETETEMTNGELVSVSCGQKRNNNKKEFKAVIKKDFRTNEEVKSDSQSSTSETGKRRSKRGSPGDESSKTEQGMVKDGGIKQEITGNDASDDTGSSAALFAQPKRKGRVARSKVASGKMSTKPNEGDLQVKVEGVSNEADNEIEGKSSDASGKRTRGRKRVIKEDENAQSSVGDEGLSVSLSKPKRSRRAKVKQENMGVGHESKTGTSSSKNSARKRKKIDKNIIGSSDGDVKIEPVPLPAKTTRPNKGDMSNKFVGAHCSISGGMWNAVNDAVTIGAKSFALFLRSQRQWQAKPLLDDVAARFREACAKHGFPPHLILPHGSYLLNCGSPNPETLAKSRESLVDELQRCEKLGLTLYNFHPGSTCGKTTVDECLDKIGDSINMALEKTSGVTTVIENMSCQGNTVGGRFEELRGIIDRVKDKSRIGVCLDTCHAFAAGYDLSSESGFNQMMAEFDKIVGFQYLKGVHINDSKGEVGCHLDRHENIGRGQIGLEGFRRVMNDPRFDNIPLILETPPEGDYAKEIKTLYSLVD